MSRQHYLEWLELHVAHACNLSCESCSHYSNHNLKGFVDPVAADAWMSAWSHRLDVGNFNLLGGEPTLNPRLSEFIPLVRKHWPETRIIIVTNGFFLDRHPDLPRVLAENGDARLAVSIHHDAPSYRARVQPNLDLLARWGQDFGVSFDIWPSYSDWTRRYQGFGDSMAPFEDENPRASWETCRAKRHRQLFEGKLWKCAPIAYLPLQKEAYALSEKWNAYLRPWGLEPTCEDGELLDFLNREDEQICSMCSAERRAFQLQNPMNRREDMNNRVDLPLAEREVSIGESKTGLAFVAG